MKKIFLFGTKDVKKLLLHALSDKDLSKKNILDFPSGSGFTSDYLYKKGAKVIAADVFPEFFKHENIQCLPADLQKKFPFADDEFDICIFQEGIEHLPNQLFALTEFNRVLKKSGTLFLTTPNYSNIRSRVAYLLFESETPKMFPPNEIDSIWYGSEDKVYFGHIFSIGIMKLRVLCRLAGFEIKKVHPSRINFTSILLGIFIYPLILFKNTLLLGKNIKHKQKKDLYFELFKLNMHPSVIFGGHLILELTKKPLTKSYRESKIIET